MTIKNVNQKVSEAYRDNPFWDKETKIVETRMERGQLLLAGRTITLPVLEEIIDVLNEVYLSHSRPSDLAYNECDKVPCSLCIRIEDILNEINP